MNILQYDQLGETMVELLFSQAREMAEASEVGKAAILFDFIENFLSQGYVSIVSDCM